MKLSIHSHWWKLSALSVLLGVIAITLGLGTGVFVSSTILNDDSPPPIQKPIVARPQGHDAEVTKAGKIEPDLKPDAIVPPVSGGYAPVLYKLDTKQPVVFLTIDDGAEKGADFAAYIKQKHLKASLFLANTFIANDYAYFRPFVEQGMKVEDHTLSHDLKFYQQSAAYQQQEICGMADVVQQQYGRRPTLFRPPGGSFTSVTQQAAALCGMRAIVHWHAKVNGGYLQYQEGDKLQPGDIVLMHFRPAFKADVDAFVAEIEKQKLHTELLEDWITP